MQWGVEGVSGVNSAVYGVKMTLLRKFYQMCIVQYSENNEAEI